MAEDIIRIGILGCAKIAIKVSRAIIVARNAQLTAIASRSIEKAKAFAKANNFPVETKIYGSYELLIDDPEIDAVYVPLPTSLHVKWVSLAAKKKKHVLCEKPVGLTVKEVDEILNVCEENGVQIMDGTMWMHHVRTKMMKEFLNDDERFGKLKTVHSSSTFARDEIFLKNDIRVKPDLDALGALGDVGWYCIRAILWASDYELPNAVVALPGTVKNEAGVIMSCSAALHWADGKVANFHCSFLSHLTTNITATGTKGTLQINDFIIPFEERQAHFIASSQLGFNELVTGWAPLPSLHVVDVNLPQEACMVKEFARLVVNVKANGAKPDQTWPIITRKTHVIIDAVKESIERGCETVDVVS